MPWVVLLRLLHLLQEVFLPVRLLGQATEAHFYQISTKAKLSKKLLPMTVQRLKLEIHQIRRQLCLLAAHLLSPAWVVLLSPQEVWHHRSQEDERGVIVIKDLAIRRQAWMPRRSWVVFSLVECLN